MLSKVYYNFNYHFLKIKQLSILHVYKHFSNTFLYKINFFEYTLFIHKKKIILSQPINKLKCLK